MSYPTPNIFYSTAGAPPYIPDDETPTDTNEPYLDWLNFVMSQKTIPQTISTSYGDDEQTVPLDYATSVCNMFARLGAMGVSVLFSSGDSGVGGGSCHLNDGKGSKKFIPAFPASCGCFFIDNITNTRDLLMVIARSLCHDSWWHNSSEPRGGGQLLRRRFFELLFSRVLSGRSRLFIPPEHW
jgi:hypothetical protein